MGIDHICISKLGSLEFELNLVSKIIIAVTSSVQQSEFGALMPYLTLSNKGIWLVPWSWLECCFRGGFSYFKKIFRLKRRCSWVVCAPFILLFKNALKYHYANEFSETALIILLEFSKITLTVSIQHYQRLVYQRSFLLFPFFPCLYHNMSHLPHSDCHNQAEWVIYKLP